MLVFLRGGGDLASGVALRLQRAGLQVFITELARPLAVRRLVSFASAIYEGRVEIEGVGAWRVENLTEARRVLSQGEIPVLVDPDGDSRLHLNPDILIDGRMTKHFAEIGMQDARLVIGLGPGFIAGENCHAVVETQRGHFLGRVIWQGAPAEDTGIPEPVGEHSPERVIRAPADGQIQPAVQIGERLDAGQLIAMVGGRAITAPFQCVLRGLIHPDVPLRKGMKIGDLDPRNDLRYCTMVSDKSLAIGGGVLEAILSRRELRSGLWA